MLGLKFSEFLRRTNHSRNVASNMKKTLSLLIICLNISSLFAQDIDELNTNKKVARFLKKEINKEYSFKFVFDKEKEDDEEDFNDFIKIIDIDNNGMNDLIVNGYSPLIIVLNYGENNYKEIDFKRNLFSDYEPELDTIVKIKNETIFVFETKVSEFDETVYHNTKIKKDQEVLSYDFKTKESKWVIKDEKYKVDSLTIKFGELVSYKYHKPNNQSKIKEINFSTTRCFGSCPVFEIKLDSDSLLEYNGIMFTNFKGKTTKKLELKEFNSLIGLVEYADIKKLDDSYSVNWTDDQTVKLKVVFENGDTKEIQDYGLMGTINLQAIYNKLFEISQNIE